MAEEAASSTLAENSAYAPTFDCVRPVGSQRTAPALEPLDVWLAHDDLYALPPSLVTDIRVEFLRAAVEHHRNHNPHYDRYCAVQDFGDDVRLESVADLEKIPLLPCAVFKRNRGADRIRTGGSTVGLIETTSSGTQGTVSVVPRDDTTLMRFFASVAIGNRELFGVEGFDRSVLSLGPRTSDAPNLWIAYIMSGLAVVFPTSFYVDAEDHFDLATLAHDLGEASGDIPVTLVGPPPLLVDLAAHLEAVGPLDLGPETLVATIGGWKRRLSESITREEFNIRLADALGIPDAGRIRDTFNMVELNSAFFECAFHRKHCPPWVVVHARDPESLAPLPSGAAGVLSFLDPTATSYPAFILSDDFGTVQHAMSCQCGIVGDVVSILRRVDRVESRGCALKLDRAR
jgi:long-chain-fatty-acid---luciferin-component ligase